MKLKKRKEEEHPPEQMEIWPADQLPTNFLELRYQLYKLKEELNRTRASMYAKIGVLEKENQKLNQEIQGLHHLVPLAEPYE
jgi:hypothetical protein